MGTRDIEATYSAGEFAAKTPYFYSTYEEEDEATPIEGERAVVVGSGPIRIGQGIEFDLVFSGQHRNDLVGRHAAERIESVFAEFDAAAIHRLLPGQIMQRHGIGQGTIAIKNQSGDHVGSRRE